MKVELTPDAARWVEAEIAAGTFSTPEDAVGYAISEMRGNALRATPDAAVANGGDLTMVDGFRYSHEPAISGETAEATSPQRTPKEAAARMLARRSFHHLPEGMTIRDLMTHGRT